MAWPVTLRRSPSARGLMVLGAVLFLLAACSRNEQMRALYAQRCAGCHGPTGKGDGPVATLLPVRVPDFRETVERKSVIQIRRVIAEGKGLMPAFGPALSGLEIQDMVRSIRLLSQQGRSLQWWEKFQPLVYAHCSVPWEFVLGYDREGKEDGR